MKKVLSVLFAFALCLSCLPTMAFADAVKLNDDLGEDKGYYFADQAIKDDAYKTKPEGMFTWSQEDNENFSSFFSWLFAERSYPVIKVDPTTKQCTYYFNAPALQTSLLNTVRQFNKGGYAGEYQRSDTDDIQSDDQQNTALERYGWDFPNLTYLGETPACYYSVTELVGGIANAGNAIKTFLPGITAEYGWKPDTNTLNMLVDTSIDYDDSVFNRENFIANADTLCEKSKEVGIAEDADATEPTSTIYDYLKLDEIEGTDNFGAKFLDRIFEKKSNANQILLTLYFWSGIPFPSLSHTRYSPYNLQEMTWAGQSYFNVISDPRCDYYTQNKGFLGLTGTTSKSIQNMFVSVGISVTSAVSKVAKTLNSVCDLTVAQDLTGIKINTLWTGEVGQFILSMFALAIIVVCVGQIWQLTTRGTSPTRALLKCGGLICVLGVLGACVLFPAIPENLATNLVPKIMNLGTATLDTPSSNFSQLSSSSANAKEKSDLRFWALPFAAWTKYNTNSNLTSDNHTYNVSEGTNEYTGYANSATLNGKTIDLWNAVMLEEMTQNSNNKYRALDHYMSPKITMSYESSTGANTKINVEENPHYTGYVQTSITFPYVLFAFTVLIFVTLKILYFFTVFFELILLFLRVAIVSFHGAGGIKQEFALLGRAMLGVAIVDTIISVVFYFAYVLNDTASLLTLSLAWFIFSIWVYKKMWQSFTPYELQKTGKKYGVSNKFATYIPPAMAGLARAYYKVKLAAKPLSGLDGMAQHITEQIVPEQLSGGDSQSGEQGEGSQGGTKGAVDSVLNKAKDMKGKGGLEEIANPKAALSAAKDKIKGQKNINDPANGSGRGDTAFDAAMRGDGDEKALGGENAFSNLNGIDKVEEKGSSGSSGLNNLKEIGSTVGKVAGEIKNAK